MPASYYLEQMPSDVTIGLRNFIDWLLGTSRGDAASGAGTAGPGWTLIEADDGTVREVPSGGTTLADLSAGNKWRTGATLPLSAWCVVQGAGTLGNPLQVLARVENSTGRFAFQMIPLADWTTGGGSTSTPTLPATTVPATPTAPDTLTASGYLYCTADLGMFALAYDNKTTLTNHWWYVGEVDPPDIADDPRPFVFWDDPNDPLDGEDWRRLSPVDNVTLLGGSNAGRRMCYAPYDVTGALTSGAPPKNALSKINEYSLGVDFITTSHDHDAGVLRYVTGAHVGIGARGTVTYSTADDRITVNAKNGDICILHEWDGTVYP